MPRSLSIIVRFYRTDATRDACSIVVDESTQRVRRPHTNEGPEAPPALVTNRNDEVTTRLGADRGAIGGLRRGHFGAVGQHEVCGEVPVRGGPANVRPCLRSTNFVPQMNPQRLSRLHVYAD